MKMWVIVILAVVAAAPILVAIQNQPSPTKKWQQAQQANQPIPVNVNCNCAAKADDSKDKPQGWHKLVTWPEGIGVWALIATLIVIGWQSCETRRATNSQRNKDRARLTINIVEAGENYILSRGSDPTAAFPDFYWNFFVEITQRGDTKAFNVRGRATIIVRPPKESRPTLPSKAMMDLAGIPSIIEGDEQKLISATMTIRTIPDNILNEINRGDKVAHFFGHINYEDVFGAKHKSTFRYRWTPEEREDVPGVPGETFTTVPEGWEQYGKRKDNRAN